MTEQKRNMPRAVRANLLRALQTDNLLMFIFVEDRELKFRGIPLSILLGRIYGRNCPTILQHLGKVYGGICRSIDEHILQHATWELKETINYCIRSILQTRGINRV